jgi:hypothetical protein
MNSKATVTGQVVDTPDFGADLQASLEAEITSEISVPRGGNIFFFSATRCSVLASCVA